MTTPESQPGHGKRPGRWRLLLLLALVAGGIAADALGWVDWRALLELSRRHADQPWLPLALVSLEVLLYSLAMPGSLLIIPLATLYSPMLATALFVCGAALGALGAYRFSSRLSQQWRSHVQAHPVFRLLVRHGDFPTMTALRLLPGFPHSVINYSAGLLALPQATFLAAAVLGMSIKFYLYARAIHHAAAAQSPAELMRADTLVPLLVLSALFAAGQLLRHRRRTPSRRDAPGGDMKQ